MKELTDYQSECWLNVYHYHPQDYTFVGDTKFLTRHAANQVAPEAGLKVVYRIHVRLK